MIEDRTMRVMVIGLDGATFKVLLPWIKGKQLHFISESVEEGVYGELETVYPTLSTLAWPCFYTGKNPGKLGIFGYTLVEDLKNFKKKERIVNSSHVNSLSLWKILSNHQKKVGVINIPVTFPPEPVNGFMISGFMTPPKREYTYPPTLKEELEDYEIDLEFEGKYGEMPDTSVNKEVILEKQYEITRKRYENARKLLRREELDFFTINFKGIDTMQHLFWDSKNVLLDFYVKVDEYIAKLYQTMEPSHLFLMSDHGFHKAANKYFFINTWLERNCYLKRRGSFSNNLLNKLISVGLYVASKSNLIRGFLSTSTKESFLNLSSGRQIDFDKTKAYGSRWGIFMNEPNISGENLKEMLISDLRRAKDPKSGKRIFKNLLRGEEVYTGEFVDKLPDIIPITYPEYKIMPNLTEEVIMTKIDKPYLQGQHKSDPLGILIVRGDEVKKGKQLDRKKIVDLFPTILHMMKIPIPLDVDGRVMMDIFELKSRFRRKIMYQEIQKEAKEEKTYLKEDEEEIRKRLEQLGYL